jgi:hypothetical protein
MIWPNDNVFETVITRGDPRVVSRRGSTSAGQSAHRCGDTVSLTRLELISVRGWADPRPIVRPEGLDQMKNLITSSRMKPATL